MIKEILVFLIEQASLFLVKLITNLKSTNYQRKEGIPEIYYKAKRKKDKGKKRLRRLNPLKLRISFNISIHKERCYVICF
jgi:hypothetical protein